MKCKYCQGSGIFLRSDAYGLCKKCQAEIRAKAVEVRDKIKGDLISARFLEDPDRKVHHLRRALEGTKKLFQYERLGCPRQNPSPAALKAFLEEKLWESTGGQQPPEAGATDTRAGSRSPPDNPLTTDGPLISGTPSATGPSAPRGNGGDDSRFDGTRRVRRHPAMFGVWLDRDTPAVTEDVSSRGLCVRSELLLKPGTRVTVTLEALDLQVSGEGMVRWAHRKETDEDGSNHAIMGVEFLVPPPELQGYA